MKKQPILRSSTSRNLHKELEKVFEKTLRECEEEESGDEHDFDEDDYYEDYGRADADEKPKGKAVNKRRRR